MSNNNTNDFKTGTASAGATQPVGKRSESDAVFVAGQRKDVRQPEKVRELPFTDPNKGTAHRAAQRQIEGEDGVENGNPKRRTANSWGVKEKK